MSVFFVGITFGGKLEVNAGWYFCRGVTTVLINDHVIRGQRKTLIWPVLINGRSRRKVRKWITLPEYKADGPDTSILLDIKPSDNIHDFGNIGDMFSCVYSSRPTSMTVLYLNIWTCHCFSLWQIFHGIYVYHTFLKWNSGTVSLIGHIYHNWPLAEKTSTTETSILQSVSRLFLAHTCTLT